MTIIFSALLIGSCANIQRSAEVINGFVKVHDSVQKSVTDTQNFCADMYIALLDHEKEQKRLIVFCDRVDQIFNEIQRIEKQFLKDSVK